MSLIEQAAKRLEELRRAGIDVPWSPGDDAKGKIEPSMAPAPGVANNSAQLEAFQPTLPPLLASAAEEAELAEAGSLRSKQVNIDLRRLAAEGYLTPDDARSGLAEELRAIKRPIIEHVQEARHAGQSQKNLILVTSALPGEGKTYCAINLAMSIAMEVDHSVLLVDADVVRPSVMSRLGIEAELGMLDVLIKPSLDLSDVLIRTNIPKLTLLPAGSAVAKSTELLASSAMERLLSDLAVRYPNRIVIFDGPPLLDTSESRVLASRMGQVVVVVEAHKTPNASIAQSFADLQACETVWCVLNKAASPRVAASYYERGSDSRGG